MTGRMQTGGIQDRRNARQEGYRTGGMKERRYEGQYGYRRGMMLGRTGGMQFRGSARQEDVGNARQWGLQERGEC